MKKFRIVKEETIDVKGQVTARFIPQYKGWFLWNDFSFYDASRDKHFIYSFNDEKKAENFLNDYVRLNGLRNYSVVKEFHLDLS